MSKESEFLDIFYRKYLMDSDSMIGYTLPNNKSIDLEKLLNDFSVFKNYGYKNCEDVQNCTSSVCMNCIYEIKICIYCYKEIKKNDNNRIYDSDSPFHLKCFNLMTGKDECGI